MAYTATTVFGQRLEARLEPWMTEDLARLCDAIGTMWQPILELAEEEGNDGEAGYVPAWGKSFDAETANLNELRYLSNFVGVEIPQGASEAEARALVKAESGMERGTLQAIEAACVRALGKGVPFTIRERENAKGEEDAYHFVVFVPRGKASQTLYNAINGVRPAGLWYTVVETEGAWLSGTRAWSEIEAGRKWSELTEGTF